MARSREVIYMSDFTGGLNLTTQLQSLNQNESPDALNVDFGLRGGFILRGGFQTQGYSLNLDGARFICPTYYGSADLLLVAGSDGSLYEWDGSSLTDTTEDLTDTTIAANPIRGASFDSKTYFANGRSSGNIIMQSWDGTTLTTLTNGWNNDYTSPAGGDMPLARHVKQHNGYLWVADTVESATRYPHRVRFSHLQEPEDWAEADYFDVDPDDDGDPITALVPFRDHLLIFKKSSVWACYGFGRADFFVERITPVSGVNDPRQVTVNSGVCYWFSGDGHLVLAYNGRGVVPLTDGLRWWSDIGKIDHGGDHVLMWSDGRLFLSLEAGSGQAVNRWLFVYDPVIKALTRYDKIVDDMFHWIRLDDDADPLFLFENDRNMFRFDRSYEVDTDTPDTIDDVTGDPILDVTGDPLRSVDIESVSNRRIEGYYRTAWITAGETATKKRWKRPRVTAAASGDTNILVEIYHDFQESQLTKTTEIFIDAVDEGQWGSMSWGEAWGSPEDETYKFARITSAGSGHAVQFLFRSVDNPGRWWVDSIAVPFRRKEVR